MSLTQNNYSHSTFTDHNIGNSGCAPDTKRSSVENGIKNFEIGSTFDNRNDRREYRVIARRDAPKGLPLIRFVLDALMARKCRKQVKNFEIESTSIFVLFTAGLIDVSLTLVSWSFWCISSSTSQGRSLEPGKHQKDHIESLAPAHWTVESVCYLREIKNITKVCDTRQLQSNFLRCKQVLFIFHLNSCHQCTCPSAIVLSDICLKFLRPNKLQSFWILNLSWYIRQDNRGQHWFRKVKSEFLFLRRRSLLLSNLWFKQHS